VLQIKPAMIIVDRIEEGLAVCEIDGATVDIPLSEISGKPREGDVLIATADGAYTVDTDEAERRRSDISAQFERLKARKNSQG